MLIVFTGPQGLHTLTSQPSNPRGAFLSLQAEVGKGKLIIFCSCFQKIYTALAKADSFLLERTLPSKSTFTLAIVAYALSLGDRSHPRFRSIVSALKREALVKGRTSPHTVAQRTLAEHRGSVRLGNGCSESRRRCHPCPHGINHSHRTVMNPVTQIITHSGNAYLFVQHRSLKQPMASSCAQALFYTPGTNQRI